ncbi:DMT family transporter [Burkholderia thailandensis]|uniref:DMT family transporter n=1 Tax=Burkholderia thailandensis TaxID=57975 RepID=UPI00192D5197|nr:DMT family transporter [Burkholderia thailandensis]QRA13363.1 DMT family transporter [Burkholderia thailandensis]
MSARTNAAFTALLAAALFGATTPLAKTLLGSLTPFMVAGLFYLGSGIGLAAFMLLRRLARGPGASQAGHARLPLAELPWLAGAVAAGALLLNLEGVFTAVIAWVVFRENVDAQIFAGMIAIVAGGVLLSWHPGAAGVPLGALLVAAACACWAIDNNLTRKVSTHDAATIACIKGLVAGTVNLGIALALGARLPAAAERAAAMLTGFAGYGVSLVLFVVALRNLGTARTGAYFSVAPLFGVGLSLALWPEWPPRSFWAAAALMAIGIWLHLRERHEHPHTHEALEHSHRHRHDEHHQHAHDFDWDGAEPHTHAHRHTPITHTHAHFPDIHHRHSH